MENVRPEDHVEIVRTTARLREIGPAWTALWSSADASIFQSHAWVLAWWLTAMDKERRQLHIGLAWRDGELGAVLALSAVRKRGLRVLEWAAKDHSDYCDALIAPDLDRTAVICALWTQVVAEGRFDLIYLSHVLPNAAIRALFDHASAGAPFLRRTHRRQTNLRIAIQWPSGDAWFQSLPAKVRQNYNRRRRLLSKEGELVFRQCGPDEPLRPIIDRLAEAKRKWLTSQGLRSSLIADDNAPLLAFVKVLAEAGILRLFLLECGGQIVAGSINFVQRQTMMVYMPSYDQKYERASPGTLLMTDYIRWSIDHGAREIDFLCGDEEYKRKLASFSVELDSFMRARTLAGAAAITFDRFFGFCRTFQKRYAPIRFH